MNRVVVRAALIKLIAPYYPEGGNSKGLFAPQTVLRIHLHSRNGSPCYTRRLPVRANGAYKSGQTPSLKCCGSYMRPGKRKALDKSTVEGTLLEAAKKL